MARARSSLAQTFARRLAWRLEVAAYDAITALARLFPIDAVSDFGAAALGRLGPMTSAHRVAVRNLQIAFPDLTAAEIDALAAQETVVKKRRYRKLVGLAHEGMEVLLEPRLGRPVAECSSPRALRCWPGSRRDSPARGRDRRP